MRTVLTGAGLLLVLILSCGPTENQASDNARTTAEAFLTELRGGRLESAWQSTSVEFKSIMGLENLRDYVRAHPALKAPADFVETRPLTRQGLPLSECVFHATLTARRKTTTVTIKVWIAQEEGTWKVERLVVE
jgi:hypothetical protein